MRSLAFLTAAFVCASTPVAAAYIRPGETKTASVASDGSPATGFDLKESVLSGNERYVAFPSDSPNLHVPDANPGTDVFVHDRRTAGTTLVSLSSRGEQGLTTPLATWDDYRPALSHTGRFVAFTSTASNLVSGDTNVSEECRGPCADVFVHDRVRLTTERVSVSTEGTEGNSHSFLPSISADGRRVTFTSRATNLVPGDTNDSLDIFVHDRRTHGTTRVSVASNGDQGNWPSRCSAIDATGGFVVFGSDATNLPDGTGDSRSSIGSSASQVFVRDLNARKTEMVSLASDGTPASGGCGSQSAAVDISAGGRYVAFASDSSKLVPNDSHVGVLSLYWDTFVRDRTTGRTRRVSVTSFGEESVQGNSGGSFSGAHGLSLSDDGRYVVFGSDAKNLFPDDREIPVLGDGTVGDPDVFLHDMETGVTELISIDTRGLDGACRTLDEETLPLQPIQGSEAGHAEAPSLGAHGRAVAFSSCDRNLVHGPEEQLDGLSFQPQIYVRSRGRPLGYGGFANEGSYAEREDGICIGPDVCIPPFGGLSKSDESQRPTMPLAWTDLLEAHIYYRPQLEDLFVVLDLEHLPTLPTNGVGAETLPFWYGFRFTVERKAYEARATSLLGGTFGLFDCTDSSICTKVADLRGGYGTTGERVVFSLPLEAVGLEDGGELSDVEAFSALGSYFTGPTKILDTVKIQ